MKKYVVLFLSLMMLVACQSKNDGIADDKPEVIEPVEEVNAQSIVKELNTYIENTLSLNNKYVITGYKKTDFYGHGVVIYQMVSNPEDKLSFITSTRSETGPSSIRNIIYDGKYYDVRHEGMGLPETSEVAAFDPLTMEISLKPNITFYDLFALASADNIKDFKITSDEGIKTFSLVLNNHKVLDDEENGYTFLEIISEEDIIDTLLTITVKDEKIVTWEYVIDLEVEGQTGTMRGFVDINDDVESMIEDYVGGYKYFYQEVPWFLEDFDE